MRQQYQNRTPEPQKRSPESIQEELDDIERRLAQPDCRRQPGRPPQDQALPAPEPAEILPPPEGSRRVPPMRCPHCGRGMEPRVFVAREKYAECACRLCSRHFDYFYESRSVRRR